MLAYKLYLQLGRVSTSRKAASSTFCSSFLTIQFASLQLPPSIFQLNPRSILQLTASSVLCPPNTAMSPPIHIAGCPLTLPNSFNPELRTYYYSKVVPSLLGLQRCKVTEDTWDLLHLASQDRPDFAEMPAPVSARQLAGAAPVHITLPHTLLEDPELKESVATILPGPAHSTSFNALEVDPDTLMMLWRDILGTEESMKRYSSKVKLGRRMGSR